MSKQRTNEVKSNQQTDNFKWLVIVVVLLIGVVSNDYLRHISFSLCLLVWCAILAGCGWLFSHTLPGYRFRQFVVLACQELSQVVWPDRDEVIRTTAMVAAIVFVVSFILWLIDLALVRMLGFFIG